MFTGFIGFLVFLGLGYGVYRLIKWYDNREEGE